QRHTRERKSLPLSPVANMQNSSRSCARQRKEFPLARVIITHRILTLVTNRVGIQTRQRSVGAENFTIEESNVLVRCCIRNIEIRQSLTLGGQNLNVFILLARHSRVAAERKTAPSAQDHSFGVRIPLRFDLFNLLPCRGK